MAVAAALSRRSRALLAGALALAFAAAGCGGGAREGGGSITLALVDSVSLDPRAPSDPLATPLLALLHEGLVRFDTAGAVRPAHATSWQVSDDRLTYTFELEERRFEDGTLIEASAYAQTLEAVFADSRSPGRPRFWSLGGAIARRRADRRALAIRAVDARTLEVRLDAPDDRLLEKLAHPSYAVPTADPEAERSAGHALASGAYRIASREPRALVLVKNPHYRGDSPGSLDTIYVRIGVGGRRAMLGLASGQLDLLWPAPGEFRDRLLREPELRRVVDPGPASSYWALVLNTEIAPTARRLVRQATARSVNRQRLLDLLGERASPWRTFSPGRIEAPPAGGTLAPGFDPIAALADLDAARAGRGVPLTVVVPRGSVELAIARAILADMSRGGVYAETRSLPRSQARRALLDRRFAAATIGWWVPATSDPLADLAEGLLNRGLDEKWEGNLGFFRIGGGAELDSLLLRVLRARGEEARSRGREEIEGRLAEDLPYVPIARVREEAFYRADLDGVRFRPYYGLDLSAVRRRPAK